MKRFGEACDGGHAPIVSGTETSESFSWKRSGLAPDPQHTLTGKGLHGRASRMRCGASCLPAGGVSLRSPTGCHRPPTKIRGSALCPAWHWPLQRQGRAFFLMLASCLGSLQNTASTLFPSRFLLCVGLLLSPPLHLHLDTACGGIPPHPSALSLCMQPQRSCQATSQITSLPSSLQ